MIVRSLVLLALALGGLGISPTHRSAVRYSSIDDGILRQASVGLKRHSSAQILRWLDEHRAVGLAMLGWDRRTIDIRFRDGMRGAILPATAATIRLPAAAFGARVRPSARVQVPAGRALVLEPAATELGLGPTAGDVEVNQLRAAGYQVDQLYDAAVSVSAMARLSEYNVTYIHTHSGTSAGGDGVVATGQIANDDPSVQPLIQNGSVIKITVSGSKDLYYGITSTYIHSYEGQFPAGSLLFLNGCDMLQAPVYWQALQSKGVGVLVSWDREALSVDNYLAGAWFFAEMNQGQTVASAITLVKAAGYGTSASTSGKQTATLGYLGNGTITLRSAAQSSPGPVTPVTTPPTTRPTAVAVTPTPGPTATPTTIPGPPLTVQLKHRVDPGARQIITIRSAPDTILHIHIAFPNGATRAATTATDGAGVARYMYPQHANRITFNHVFARVSIEALKNGGVSRRSMLYRIGWSPVDVSVQPSEQSVGKRVRIWVHTDAHTAMTISLRFPKGLVKQFSSTTGKRGWASVRYRIGRYLKSGNNHTVVVRASAVTGGAMHRAKTTFRIM